MTRRADTAQDATRPRRTKGEARRAYYAWYRSARWALHYFGTPIPAERRP